MNECKKTQCLWYMETGNVKITSILLEIVKEIKDESEIKANADVDSDDRMRKQRYI